MGEPTDESDAPDSDYYRHEGDRAREARDAAVDGLNSRKTADDFVAEALKNRFSRISEAPDSPHDPTDPYYQDAANRATAERKVSAEDATFKEELEAFGRRNDVEYWNDRVEREVLEIAYRAYSAGQQLTLEDAYRVWRDTRGPGEVSLRMRALMKKQPAGSRDYAQGSQELEAERQIRIHRYEKPKLRGESAKDALNRSIARLSRDRE